MDNICDEHGVETLVFKSEEKRYELLEILVSEFVQKLTDSVYQTIIYDAYNKLKTN